MAIELIEENAKAIMKERKKMAATLNCTEEEVADILNFLNSRLKGFRDKALTHINREMFLALGGEQRLYQNKFIRVQFMGNILRWIIQELSLVDKVAHQEQLTKEDYSLIGAILCSLSSRKERVNYFFIFGLSAVALLLAVYMDFLKR